NVVYGNSSMISDVILNHRELAGVHFTGSTEVFNNMWKTIGHNIDNYKSYYRIVGETGDKDFVIAHSSADVKALVAGLVRGAFEFQGQKCSAASRAYIPQSLWNHTKELMLAELATIKMGSPENLENFVTAVISEESFDKLAGYIER